VIGPIITRSYSFEYLKNYIFWANKHPEQLPMMDPPRCHLICNEDDDVQMAEDTMLVERTACGLNIFMFKPKHLKGEALFKHMVQHRSNGAEVKSRVSIMYLDVQHSEA
jgi:hypothetical protein